MEYLWFLLIPVMAILSRASGSDGRFGTLWTSWSGFPELAYGIVFANACYLLTHNWWLALILGVVSWRGMELGHGTFYDMQGWRGADGPPHFGSKDKPRMQGIDYIVLPVFRALGVDPRQPAYSWAAMGIKGLVIGLPLLAFAPLQSMLFVSAYAINRKWMPARPELAEWTAGAAAGFVIALALIVG